MTPTLIFTTRPVIDRFQALLIGSECRRKLETPVPFKRNAHRYGR